MEQPAIETSNDPRLLSLQAQRSSMMEALDLHVKRSEDLASVIAEIDRDIKALTQEVTT